MQIDRDNLSRFIKGGNKGKKNHKWKGNNVLYFSLHSWIIREYGKANKCEECGGIYRVEWANISGKYKRDIKDWKQLCCVCHRAFDGITKLTKEQANEIKVSYIDGIKQVILAKKYNVDQGTISNIINNKIQYYA